jgi:hypothetical protein
MAYIDLCVSSSNVPCQVDQNKRLIDQRTIDHAYGERVLVHDFYGPRRVNECNNGFEVVQTNSNYTVFGQWQLENDKYIGFTQFAHYLSNCPNDD